VIDLKVQTIGGKEIADKLSETGGALRVAVRAEMAAIGEEVRSGAVSRAPERTGVLKSRIISYFGREVTRQTKGRQYQAVVETASKHARKSTKERWAQSIILTVRPTGRVAHLMERGVSATFQQRAGGGSRKGSKPGQHVAAITEPKWQHAKSLTYQRTLTIRPRPFFMPSVEAAGGAAGVNARLQAVIDQVATELQRSEA
jgi:hypothetical protein